MRTTLLIVLLLMIVSAGTRSQQKVSLTISSGYSAIVLITDEEGRRCGIDQRHPKSVILEIPGMSYHEENQSEFAESFSRDFEGDFPATSSPLRFTLTMTGIRSDTVWVEADLYSGQNTERFYLEKVGCLEKDSSLLYSVECSIDPRTSQPNVSIERVMDSLSLMQDIAAAASMGRIGGKEFVERLRAFVRSDDRSSGTGGSILGLMKLELLLESAYKDPSPTRFVHPDAYRFIQDDVYALRKMKKVLK